MPYQFEFEKKEIYQSLKTGITIDAILRYGNRRHDCSAKVDTGSDACLFEREIADILEIDVEDGFRENFGTLTSSFAAFQHEIELETLGLKFQTKVYFAEDYAIHRNLLGRRGFLQLITLGLNDYDCELYLSSRF